MRGDTFRTTIADLLRIQFSNVREEHHLKGKNADIVFDFEFPPGVHETVAVECKDWSRKLQSSEISSIVSEYQTAMEAREIQRLWIVAPQEIGALPSETVAAYGSKVSFFSYAQFEKSVVLDFTLYLKFLVDDFYCDILSNFYVPTHSSDGTAIHEGIILPWLADQSAKPIAVVSGYGTGKTSYARFLAAYLARVALNQPFGRIPIYIALGQLTQHQSLRGLLNSLFSDEFALRGYSFALFDKLNRAGRFVFILDGFDEMKHAMKKRDIFDNFKDIKSLVPETSKLILFGRPDVFHTEEESLIAFGKQKIGEQYLEDPNKLQFNSFGLRFFTKDELRTFFSNYLESYVLGNIENYNDPDGFVATRKQEIETLLNSDVISRPVHAKMLGDLAVIPGHHLGDYNEYDLYKNFVEKTIDRESQKPARTGVAEGSRLIFVRRLAWWLWTKKKVNLFTVDEIPQHLKTFCLENCEGAPDEEAAVREFVTGSIVEPKTMGGLLGNKRGIYFFFPHKSYWEFLVAEYLCSHDLSRSELNTISDSINEAILNFALQRRNKSNLDELLAKFSGVRVKLSYSICALFLNAPQVAARRRDSTRFGVTEWWNLVAEILYVYEHSNGHDIITNVEKIVLGNRYDLNADFGSAIVGTLAAMSVDDGEIAPLLIAFVLLSFDTANNSSRIRQHIDENQRENLHKLMSTIYNECFFPEPDPKRQSVRLNLQKLFYVLEGNKGSGILLSMPENDETDMWVVADLDQILRLAKNNNETREMNRLLDKVCNRKMRNDN